MSQHTKSDRFEIQTLLWNSENRGRRVYEAVSLVWLSQKLEEAECPTKVIRLLFLRDPGPQDSDYIVSIAELQAYAQDVWD